MNAKEGSKGGPRKDGGYDLVDDFTIPDDPPKDAPKPSETKKDEKVAEGHS